MIWLPSQNMVFIHIPKTGGVAVEQALQRHFTDAQCLRHHWHGCPGRHVTLTLLQEYQHPAGLAEPFCFIRHPVHWYVSMWRYLQDVRIGREKKGKRYESFLEEYKWHPMRWYVEPAKLPFHLFVKHMTTFKPGVYSSICETYTQEIDLVRFTATLAEDLESLFSGIGGKVEHTNVSKYPKPVVTAGVRSAILESEHDVIEKHFA